jgi:anti-sigma regulatory factor (Ser/Thr protein kinase)
LFYLKIQFNPKWDDIVIIRKFITSMLTQKITNHDEAFRVALVASELMENVCRYSSGGTASIILEQGTNKSDIELRIRNITI